MREGINDSLKGKCPLSGCRLLFLGGARQLAPETVVTYHFCPPCDVAFLVIDERASGGHVTTLKGHTDDLHFKQHPPQITRHARLTDREIAVYRSELVSAVHRFHGSRMATKQVRCVRNHSSSDTMSLWGVMMERELYLSGCDVCVIAFAQVRDRHYGWELAVTFVYDTSALRWQLREMHRPTVDPGLLASCLELLERLRSGYDPLSKSFASSAWGLV